MQNREPGGSLFCRAVRRVRQQRGMASEVGNLLIMPEARAWGIHSQPLACASSVAPLLTSAWVGSPSTFSVATLPSLTSME